jgi:succinyl-CoA synthetase alpha subunit
MQPQPQHRNSAGGFKYHVGISSLAQIASRDDRVCVLNILGGESSDVTPVSHAYSGGNVVFGTAPGKAGAVLETPLGAVPVFHNVRDGLAAGHRFNCGVVYLPPSAARDGVAELIRVNNRELRKIFIITEKISVHDAREIRAMGQANGIDIFGANGLGVADSWNQVRIGGALGGDNPADSLRPGSIAIFSNSGGFSTTIAQYLRMAGWGTTTVISSGKDVYIHYAAPEFAFALANDARSKAAVLYCEPGGYYEQDAVFTKPVVACVVGRWKSKLTRAVGHAGAMAGGSDDALAKERWFMDKFGVDSRQTMKDASGASQMDAKNQVSSLHGTSMLAAATLDFESNVALALLHDIGGENDRKLIAAAVAAHVNLHGRAELAAAQASRESGNAPNVVLAAAAALVGPKRQQAARAALRFMIERFHAAGLGSEFGASLSKDFDVRSVEAGDHPALVADQPDERAQALMAGVEARGAGSVFLRWLRRLPGHPTEAAVLGAIGAALAWGPLSRKRISLTTALTFPWWLQLFGTLIGASADAARHEPRRFAGIDEADLLCSASLGEIAFAALLGRRPQVGDLFAFETLVGLLLTNGPGAISAQGAKGAVSADGPEQPERVQLNKALAGFLTHTGYAHGGNGYEGIAYLMEQFEGSGLEDPANPQHGIDLKALAARAASRYASYKRERKGAGSLDIAKLPGVNHPVFKDKPVNHDPREVFIARMFEERGESNAFHAFYRELVAALFDAGVSRNVYCVNVDAVIAALLLKMLWQPLRTGEIGASELETAAFTLFLYPRMLGCAAEIDDHLNRGRNMDTRTPASACMFVA